VDLMAALRSTQDYLATKEQEVEELTESLDVASDSMNAQEASFLSQLLEMRRRLEDAQMGKVVETVDKAPFDKLRSVEWQLKEKTEQLQSCQTELTLLKQHMNSSQPTTVAPDDCMQYMNYHEAESKLADCVAQLSTMKRQLKASDHARLVALSDLHECQLQLKTAKEEAAAAFEQRDQAEAAKAEAEVAIAALLEQALVDLDERVQVLDQKCASLEQDLIDKDVAITAHMRHLEQLTGNRRAKVETVSVDSAFFLRLDELVVKILERNPSNRILELHEQIMKREEELVEKEALLEAKDLQIAAMQTVIDDASKAYGWHNR